MRRWLLLLAVLMVAGCAQMPDAGPPGAAPVTIWQPARETRALLIALHGFNDHKAAFAEFGRFMAERGIVVLAYDHPSFGENAARGLWPGTDRLVEALYGQIRQARRAYPGLPLFVLGDSMGGAVATVALARPEAPKVDGAILVAPAVWGGQTLNPLYRVVLAFAETFFPGLELTGRRLDILASDNLEALRALGRDPLYIKSTRVDAISGLVALMDEAREVAPRLRVPLLVLVGERDEVVPPGAQESFASMLESEQCLLVRYPNGWHMLLRDLQRAVVWRDVEAWANGQGLPSGLARECSTRQLASARGGQADWRQP